MAFLPCDRLEGVKITPLRLIIACSLLALCGFYYFKVGRWQEPDVPSHGPSYVRPAEAQLFRLVKLVGSSADGTEIPATWKMDTADILVELDKVHRLAAAEHRGAFPGIETAQEATKTVRKAFSTDPPDPDAYKLSLTLIREADDQLFRARGEPKSKRAPLPFPF